MAMEKTERGMSMETRILVASISMDFPLLHREGATTKTGPTLVSLHSPLLMVRQTLLPL